MNFILAVLIPALIALFYLPIWNLGNLPVKSLLSLLAAIPLHKQFHFVQSNIWNYVIWFIILFFVTAFIYWLPRSKNSLNFGMNFVLFTVGSLWAILDFAPEMVEWINFKPLHYIVLILFCAFWAFKSMKDLVEKRDLPKKWLCHIDRGIASIIMSASLSFCGLKLFSYTVHSVIFWVIAVLICAGWFVLDLYAYRKFAHYFSVKSKLSDADKVFYQNPLLYYKDPMTKEERRAFRKQWKQEMRSDIKKLNREFWSGMGNLSLDILRDIHEANLQREERRRLDAEIAAYDEQKRRESWDVYW